ncbi:MAG TPA: TIGR02757 family protein [Firmicutes bacterium]|nr:TIGR02757 family protein [Bacillota bacterium]
MESLYRKYNHREFVHPDPLEFLYRYDDIRDREIAGLIASVLAYGKVKQILRSVGTVLDKMESPREFLEKLSKASILKTFSGFRHRFTTGEKSALLLYGVKKVNEKYGSLEACFMKGFSDEDENVYRALEKFALALYANAGLEYCHILPMPCYGSACKRLNLFLRWMVRRDEVDPGGWYNVHPRKLIVPLDTHMHKIGLALGLTGRKQADFRAALDLTNMFKTITPDDPVRYDFALTRLGIRDDCDPAEIIGKQNTCS